MRPPRYQFPEIVRSATRAMAARSLTSQSVAESPEQMAAWISAEPDVAEPLRKGGYGTAFGAEDLFPLYRAMVAKGLGVPPVAAGAREAPRRARSRPMMIVALSVALAVLLLVLALAADAFPAVPGATGASLP